MTHSPLPKAARSDASQTGPLEPVDKGLPVACCGWPAVVRSPCAWLAAGGSRSGRPAGYDNGDPVDHGLGVRYGALVVAGQAGGSVSATRILDGDGGGCPGVAGQRRAARRSSTADCASVRSDGYRGVRSRHQQPGDAQLVLAFRAVAGGTGTKGPGAGDGWLPLPLPGVPSRATATSRTAIRSKPLRPACPCTPLSRALTDDLKQDLREAGVLANGQCVRGGGDVDGRISACSQTTSLAALLKIWSPSAITAVMRSRSAPFIVARKGRKSMTWCRTPATVSAGVASAMAAMLSRCCGLKEASVASFARIAAAKAPPSCAAPTRAMMACGDISASAGSPGGGAARGREARRWLRHPPGRRGYRAMTG